MSGLSNTLCRFVIIALLGLCSRLSLAVTNSDLLFFPRAEARYQSGGQDPADRDDRSSEAAVDLFGTINAGQFSGLAEFLLSDEEQEFERFQVGWVTTQDTVWLGRFHNPVGFWNTQCHHGAYLQPTIRRPGSVEFEDDGGLVPMHATGLLLQGSRSIGQHGLSYDLAVGLGPEYDPEEQSLEELNILHPGRGEHDQLFTARLTYHPEPASINQVGLFAGATSIPVADSPADSLNQHVVGAFTEWETPSLHITAELQYVRTRLELSVAPGTASMTNGYVQIEHPVGANWDVYARGENTWDDSGTSYLALLPEARTAGFLGGVRYRFWTANQLKLEVGKVRTTEDRFGEITLEWSAVFP